MEEVLKIVNVDFFIINLYYFDVEVLVFEEVNEENEYLFKG